MAISLPSVRPISHVDLEHTQTAAEPSSVAGAQLSLGTRLRQLHAQGQSPAEIASTVPLPQSQVLADLGIVSNQAASSPTASSFSLHV